MDGKRMGIVLGFVARLLLVSAVAISLSLPPSQSAAAIGIVRYAKPVGLTAGSCTSWSTACALRYALNSVAVSGDQVWVAKGTHKPGTARTATFQLKNGVAVYGGFLGTETALTQRNWTANVTILSGEIGAAGIADNSYHVVTGSGTDGTAILDGFKIVGGNADGSGGFQSDMGGGLLNNFGSPKLSNLTFTANTADFYGNGMWNSNSSPTVSNVVFAANYGAHFGGGMGNGYNSHPKLTNLTFNANSADHAGGMFNYASSNPILNNVTFLNNSADQGGAMENNANSNPVLTNVRFNTNAASSYGGAIYNYLSSPSLTNVTFSGNSAAETGGAITNHTNSNPVLTNVTFTGNTTPVYGGAIFNYQSSPALRNVTFSANHAFYGGGLYNDSSNPTLKNVTFSGNTSSYSYGGAMYNTGSSPKIENSIFWNDGTLEIYNTLLSAPIIGFSVVKGGCPGGAICTTPPINADPALGLLQNNGGSTATMALGVGSSAIDKGYTPNCMPKDQRGVVRPQAGVCDIGAYEVRAMTFVSVAAEDGYVVESGRATNRGGAANAAGLSLLVGDNALNRRYRGFLSFHTATLPDTATIIVAKLSVKEKAFAGTPFATQAPLVTDLAKPWFGTGAGLAISDWQAAATLNSAGAFASALLPVNSWYRVLLGAAGRANINKTGTTQFRLRFATEIYNSRADYLAFYSGNDATAANRPTLIVYYNP